MASSSKKKSKSKSDADVPAEAEVVDAVVIEETDPVGDTAMETVDEMADADGVGPDAVDADEEPLVEEDVSDDVEAAAEDASIAENTSDTLEVIEDEVAPAVTQPQPAERSNPILPLLFGGFLAAALGFFASQYLGSQGASVLESKINAQGETLDGLNGQVADVASQTETLDTTAGNLASELTAQSEQIAALEAQIAALTEEMNKPVPIASEAELSADLAALIANQKEEIAALQGNLKSMATFAEGQIQTAQQEAEAAELAEARAKARDGLNKVRLALASGDAFDDALPEIAGAIEIPAALSDVASGIPTQAELQSSYGSAARAALAASNRELSGDSAGDRLGLFFQDMIGSRSLTPQEGDSPDAVLSRVEAAVQNGDLAAALETIDALPDAGKAELTEWSGKAAARNDALQAFSDLTDALSAD